MRWFAVSVAVASVLGLAGCAPAAVDDGTVHIVAGINVWGDIAHTVGGDAVTVTSLISDDSQDPHDYAAGSSDLATVANADLIIENGGGYDDFFGQLVDGANSSAPVLNAVELSGLEGTANFNEHVWYSLPTAGVVAQAIAAELAVIDPAHAEQFQRNADAFTSSLDSLISQQQAIAPTLTLRAALLTEPLPSFLLSDAGFEIATPPGLATAVESGSEIPAAALRGALALIDSQTLALLAQNAQTGSAQVDTLVAAAQAADVPVLEFRELVPAGMSYLDWMHGYLTELAKLA